MSTQMKTHSSHNQTRSAVIKSATWTRTRTSPILKTATQPSPSHRTRTATRQTWESVSNDGPTTSPRNSLIRPTLKKMTIILKTPFYICTCNFLPKRETIVARFFFFCFMYQIIGNCFNCQKEGLKCSFKVLISSTKHTTTCTKNKFRSFSLGLVKWNFCSKTSRDLLCNSLHNNK